MHYTVFETALGTCGIVWNNRGIRMLQLPEGRRGQVEARLRKVHPDAGKGVPPPWVETAVRRITSHLAGERQDFSALPLDLTDVPAFHLQVYELARGIPTGGWKTYGDLAGLAGKPGGARAVGQAMGQNPIPLIIPCHRVMAAGGKPGGFSAAGGVVTKARLLALEGIELASAGLPLFQGLGALPYDRGEATSHLRHSDPVLAEAMERAGPFRLELNAVQSPFAALAESIVYQQLTGKAAATIHSRVVRLVHPRRRLTPEDLLALSDEQLRGAGLSRAKTAALKDLAAKTLDGVVPTMARLQKMDDEEIIARLTAIRGIGRWTVEMLLIFRLGRPDVLPVTDYGVLKGFRSAFGKRKLPTPKQLMKHGKRWAPYRSVAAWYLWRAADQKKRTVNSEK